MLYGTASGNLGKDAETRQVGEESVTTFSIATSRRVKGEEVTTWIRASLWGRRGEALAKFLTKGASVTCVGELGARTYTNKDGKDVTELEMRVSDIKLQGGKREDSQGTTPRQSGGYGKSGAGNSAKHTAPPEDDFGGDDKIPF